MDADHKLLYDYYLARQKEYRQETLDLLNKGETSNFKHGTSYLSRKQIEVQIENDLSLDEAINTLQNIKNSLKSINSKAILESYINSEEEAVLEVSYYEYSIKPESACESTAKHITDSAIWKMKHQSNGKDAIAYQKRLEILKRENESNK